MIDILLKCSISDLSYTSRFSINYKKYLLLKKFINVYKSTRSEHLVLSQNAIQNIQLMQERRMLSVFSFISMTCSLLPESSIVNTSLLLLTNLKNVKDVFLKRFRFLFQKRTRLFLYTLKCMHTDISKMRVLVRTTDCNFYVSILSSIPFVSNKSLRTISLPPKSSKSNSLYLLSTISGGRFGVSKKDRFSKLNFKYSVQLILSMLSRFWLLAYQLDDLNVVFEYDGSWRYLSYVLKFLRNYLKRIYWAHFNFIKEYSQSMQLLTTKLSILKRVLKKSRYRLNILYQFYRYYTKRKARKGESIKNPLKSKWQKTNAKNRIPISVSSLRSSSKELVVVNDNIKDLVTVFLPTLYGKKPPKDVSHRYTSKYFHRLKKQTLRISKRIGSKMTSSKKRRLKDYWFSLISLKGMARFGASIDVIKSSILIPHNGCRQKKLNVKGRRAERM